MDEEKTHNTTEFTDLALLTHFLGVEITVVKVSFLLTQKPMTKIFLTETSMIDCKTTKFPLLLTNALYEGQKALTEKKEIDMVSVRHKGLLGSLMYVRRRKRFELTTAVSMLGHFASPLARRH